jgi:hypothetical protein
LSLALAASVLVLLVYFHKESPPAISPEQFLNRLNNLATIAWILGGLAVLIGLGIFSYAKYKGYSRRASVRIAGPIVICLAVAVFAAAIFYWLKTEKVRALTPVQATSSNALRQRLHNATTVIRAFHPRTNRYRSAKGAGVIIGTKSGRTWILTVPYSDDSWRDLPGSDSLWVNFSDGHTLPGRVRWAAPPPINLAIILVETDAPIGEVQFHPIAEGVIPSEEVLVVPNPLLAGWTLERGTILKRRATRTKFGWSCLVDVDLSAHKDDVGSGMYDRSGRLLGLKAGFDRPSGTAQFVIVSSDILRRIITARESENFEALDALAPEVRRQ